MMKKKLFTLLFFIVIFIFAASGCGQNEQNADENEGKDKTESKVDVFTTIFPLTDFTQKIGGDYVNVESIYPANADAHTYEPTLKMTEKIAKADLFIYTGENFEAFGDKLNQTLKDGHVKIVKAAEGIKPLEAHEESEHSSKEEHAHEQEGHSHGDVDPHVWLDPIRAITIAENIKNALVEVLPDKRSVFENNFAQLKTELEQLDQTFQTTIQHSKTDVILVSHAAYGYWEDRYQLKQIPITGLSPTDEPSQKQLVGIIEKAKKYHLKYILFEQNVSPKVAKVIQQEIGAQTLTLHNLESVTKEEMRNNEDYFSLMKRNLETLKKALN